MTIVCEVSSGNLMDSPLFSAQICRIDYKRSRQTPVSSQFCRHNYLKALIQHFVHTLFLLYSLELFIFKFLPCRIHFKCINKKSCVRNIHNTTHYLRKHSDKTSIPCHVRIFVSNLGYNGNILLYICKVCRRVRCYFISHAFYVHVLMLSYYPLWILNSAKFDMSPLVRNGVHIGVSL